MTSAWDEFWLSFRALVEELNETVGAEEAGFVVCVDRHVNDAFPLRAWVSYSPLSSPGDEAVILSVDFKRAGPKVKGHVDLARADGFVLAEQRLAEPFEENSAAADDAIRAADAAVQRFAMTHCKLLKRELNRRM